MSEDQYTLVRPLMGCLPDGDGLVGLDLEADSLYRYAERICLVQVCYGESVALVDPLNGESVSPLVEWLKTARIWMHGADYDMSLMIREWGMVPPVLYDTQIAAQLLGYERFGYASLVEQFFGVELSKSSQKADWGKRPLSEKMLEYALNDVRYLLPLASKVEEKLKELGRYEWFVESCHASRDRVLAREGEEREFWRINGSGKLRPRGMVFLKSLWEWRDGEAASWNRPSFMVATNKQLIAWSAVLSNEGEIDLSPKMRPDRRRRLLRAIELAQEVPKEQWPLRAKRERHQKDEAFEEKLKSLMSKRNGIAEKLKIDPSVIASRPVLEQIVGERVQPEEILLKWQAGLLGY